MFIKTGSIFGICNTNHASTFYCSKQSHNFSVHAYYRGRKLKYLGLTLADHKNYVIMRLHKDDYINENAQRLLKE